MHSFPMKTYLTVTEIARVVKKEKTAIQRWIKAGKFERVRKVGQEYRVPHDIFRKWWAKNMRSIEPEEGQTK